MSSCFSVRRLIIVFLWLFNGTLSANLYQEKPMVIVIPSYNNSAWYQRNLDSVFSQEYLNYRVIYVDDDSPDGTGDLVGKYLQERGLEDRCCLVKNKFRKGQLFNRYKAIHECDNDEIVVLLDGDDWFKNSQVLAYLNKVYTEEQVLLTVGNACKSANGQKIGYRDYTDQEIEQFGFRQLGFRGVHPRTFYAGLFKQVKVQDLIHCGKFLMVATDVAFMLPMFEMAQGRYKYIHDILYVYNNENPINLYKSKFERQIYFDLITRNHEQYEKLEDPSIIFSQKTERPQVSHLLFMEEETNGDAFFRIQIDNGVELDTCIKVGNGDPYKRLRNGYFNMVHTLNIGYPLSQIYHFRFNFKERLLKTLKQCTSEYLLISTEKLFNSQLVNLAECVKQLEATKAFGVMLGNSDGQFLKEESYNVASFGSDMHLYLLNLWNYPQALREISDCYGMLMRKDEFINLIKQVEIFHPNYLTLLAACNSVMRQDSVFLVTHVEQEGATYDEK